VGHVLAVCRSLRNHCDTGMNSDLAWWVIAVALAVVFWYLVLAVL
jgi:hypothetical protein